MPAIRMQYEIPVVPFYLNLFMGAGVSRLTVASLPVINGIAPASSSQNKYSFAYKAGAGVGYKFLPFLAFGLGYRYSNQGTLSSPDSNPTGIKSYPHYKYSFINHEMVLRLDFSF